MRSACAMLARSPAGAFATTRAGCTSPRNSVTFWPATLMLSNCRAFWTPSSRCTITVTCASSSGCAFTCFGVSRRVSSFVHGFTVLSLSAASTFAFVYVSGPSTISSCPMLLPGINL